ncbi:hypothetical protein HIM_06610 [Hirsutella minnesotensis 3608]|uniref:Large ribosomal subunit protein bL27m n=1 Tax=Hirsutella minnesotensis 3608 TaxID=1043627 RepID=A0A0F7ZZB7_9HYPO|nr:hypothetical protein HIM_06610 [Hirsutella minnesotensis 3608]
MRLLTMRRPIFQVAAAIATAAAPPTLCRVAIRPTNPVSSQLTANLLAQGRRHASVKAQGAYKKKSKRGIPKKLGAKRTGDQYVVPGNILYKQRGTLWWPGENCIMGRDHTIHAMATGYVKYYRDPARHPDRKYIGVVFDKSDTLPYPRHAERKRRLGMTTHPIRTPVEQPAMSPSGIPYEVTRLQNGEKDRLLRLRDDYSYREDNWRIGRLVQTTGLRKTRFRTRKQYLRHRRWRREREIAGQRKAAEERKALGASAGSSKTPVSKKAAKKAKKAKRQ